MIQPPSTTPTQTTKPNVTKEGYIVKKGAKVKNWKKRYLVIETEKLSYYEDETKQKKKRGHYA